MALGIEHECKPHIDFHLQKFILLLLSMFHFGIKLVKNAFAQALRELPDFISLNSLQLGDVVDKSFKSLMKDLMNQFGMQPGKDYLNNLNDNEPASDFVICSLEANDLIKDLLEGRVVVVKEHTRVSKNGKTFTVKAYFKRLPKKHVKV